LIEADINKTLALTISFGRISRDQFWGAIQERLGPLMAEVRHRPLIRPVAVLQLYGRVIPLDSGFSTVHVPPLTHEGIFGSGV
jgi:hypothetical protein